jgi:beta-glucanase (GH16 family)
MKSLLALCLTTIAAFANPPSAAMKLVWSDEFKDPAIDETKWTFEGDKQALAIKDGKLAITLRERPDGWQGSGLSTREKFTQQQGYFEASIRFPVTKGHHGAFVIRNKPTSEPPAAALYFECFGEDKLVPWAKIGDSKGVRELRPVKTDLNNKPGQVSKGFNTYGFLWTERQYAWYFNGKLVHKLDKPEVKEPMHLFLGHWVSDFERKDLLPAKLPDDVEIDWVKIWK